MKYLIITLVAILLSGCASTKTVAPVVVNTVPIIIEIPNNYLNCKVVDNFPNPDLLTNEELGQLIVKLDTYNRECYANMGAIKSYEATVKAKYAQTYGQTAGQQP